MLAGEFDVCAKIFGRREGANHKPLPAPGAGGILRNRESALLRLNAGFRLKGETRIPLLFMPENGVAALLARERGFFRINKQKCEKIDSVLIILPAKPKFRARRFC